MSIFPTNVDARREVSPRALSQSILASVTRAVYDAPSGGIATVRWLCFCNTSSNARQVRLYHLRADETLSIKSALLYDAAIPGSTSMTMEVSIFMRAGDSIFAYASASDVALSLYGEDSR
jgi:hypothetical protein